MWVSAWVGWLVTGLTAASVLATVWALHAASACREQLAHNQEILARDKRELAQTEEDLAGAEREIARLRRIPKAELLPMLQLAHELRSPLAAVQNALDILLQGYATKSIDLQNEMLRLARERTESLLTRLDDFMRLGAVRHAEILRQVRSVQLIDVVQRLAPEFRVRARLRGIELRFDLPQALPMVKATYNDMEHLLSNLITNAIKYTNPGGRVVVRLSEEEHGVVGVVQDSGIGIAKEDVASIFQEFFRAASAREMDAYGTGLGLTIVKRIVDLYDGEISLESEVGKGSTFTFVFPRSPSDAMGRSSEQLFGVPQPEGAPFEHESEEHVA